MPRSLSGNSLCAAPKHFRAFLNLTVEYALYMLLRFQKPAVRKIARSEAKPFQCD